MPVDSIPTSVTFCAVNHSASASSCPVIVVNVRVSDRRTPPGPGRRTVATTVSRCTSKPGAPLDQHIHLRTPSPRRQGPPGVGNLSIKKLRYALEAAGQSASGSPRHTFLRAHGTKKHRRRDRTTAPILIRSPVPAPAGMITLLKMRQEQEGDSSSSAMRRATFAKVRHAFEPPGMNPRSKRSAPSRQCSPANAQPARVPRDMETLGLQIAARALRC